MAQERTRAATRAAGRAAISARIARGDARRAELDQLRLARPLTADEAAEADRLTMALYMREWRKSCCAPRQSGPSLNGKAA